MTSKISKSHGQSSGLASGRKVLTVVLLAAALAGCKTDSDQTKVAGWSLLDPNQRHPIMVSQQPAHLSVHVPRGAQGLSPVQRADVVDFVNHYRGADAGNSRLIISVPSGAPNEVAAMNATGDIRGLLLEGGFNESGITVEAFNDESNNEPPIRISYMRYVAEGPQCGQDWSQNLAHGPDNKAYANFGCSNQRNLASMIANPADLLGPRTEGQRYAERRDEIMNKYVKGQATATAKTDDERVQTNK
jgi:pilus assembly protein CpaD